MKIGIGIAIGIIFLIAASANLAMSVVGEPETHIDIYVDETGMNIIKYTNFEVNDNIEINFDRTIGSDKLDRILKSEISQTDGHGYHVGIGCTKIENGECFDLPPGTYDVDARGWLNDEKEFTSKGTIEVEK